MKTFQLGRLVATPGALRVASSERLEELLSRHAAGDWGDLSDEDRQANECALIEGERLLSAYGDGDNRVWIITEADRSHTTVLLPEEY